MKRNPMGRMAQDTIRRAVVAVDAKHAPASGSGPQGAAGTAGKFDAYTGLFKPYGRVGMTPLGEFMIAGPPHSDAMEY